MFKKIIIYFFAAIFLSTIFQNVTEASDFWKNNYKINFPKEYDNIMDFSNVVSATNNKTNGSIAVWSPERLDSEQKKICNNKSELSQLTPDELQLLSKHLAIILEKSPKNINVRSTLVNVPSLKISAPAVYYTYGGLQFLDVQIISNGLSYLLTFSAPLESFNKYEAEVFNPAIASFEIHN